MNHTIDDTKRQTATTNEQGDRAARPRLTVEVPTEITAGKPKECVHCFCSKTYCCG